MMAWLPTERLIADDHATNIKKRNANDFQHTFYGYQCFEWLCEYTTAASPEEAQAIAAEFVLYGWICELTDKPEMPLNDPDAPPSFRMTQSTLYFVTERGQKVLEWNTASMDEKASAVTSGSDQSVSDKSELVQMQQTHANRLLPTEKHANPSGVVQATIAEKKENEQKQQQQQQQQQQEDHETEPTEVHVKRIYRQALPEEASALMLKSQDEQRALAVCQQKTKQRKLPMEVVDAEYQW